MKFSFATWSEAGPRATNEDAVAVWAGESGSLAVAVADGVGGYHGGQKASEIAIRMFGDAVGQLAGASLEEVALAIHRAIQSHQQAEPKLRGMATTFTGAILSHGQVRFVHAGDTRLVLQRNNGIRRLTVDHTEAQRLLESGALSRQEYATYPRKNVLESALGVSDSPRIDIGDHNIMLGDRIFLTSDGVHSKIHLKEMRDIAIDATGPEEAVRAIVATVNARGPEDNLTVASIFID